MRFVVRRQRDETRKVLLDAAFWEIYRFGYQSASIDRILDGTRLTKGALYHHFPNKLQLGYAVVEEAVGPWIREHWVAPLEQASNPIDGLNHSVQRALADAPDELIHGGCPLNNIAQEMSNLDEGFRTRIDAVLDDWRTTISRRLTEGQAAGSVRRDLDAATTAAFLVAVFEGIAAAGKAAKSREHARKVSGAALALIDTFRASTGVVGR